MRVLSGSTEAEMVAIFLRAEIDSGRWGQTIRDLLVRHGLDRSIVDAPDLGNADEIAARARILGEFRGYGQNRSLFDGYPAAVTWRRVALDADDLPQLRYIDYSYWNELSGGTRRASVAAENVRRGVESCGVPNDGFWKAVRALQGGARFPELILVGTDATAASQIVLEGHVRLTAYLLAPEHTPAEVSALVGTAPEFATW